MLIGLDVDGCLYPWTQAVNEALDVAFGVKNLHEHTSWDYLHDTIAPEQWKWCWSKEAVSLVFERNDLIYPHCEEVVNKLCKKHDVHFVTHRNPSLCGAATATWLRNHFDGYKGIHVLHNSVSKPDVMEFDFFVDDKPDTVLEFIKTKTRIIAPARPWNEELGDEIRFKSWIDVPGII